MPLRISSSTHPHSSAQLLTDHFCPLLQMQTALHCHRTGRYDVNPGDSSWTTLYTLNDWAANDMATQTNYTVTVQLPSKPTEHAILRWRHVVPRVPSCSQTAGRADVVPVATSTCFALWMRWRSTAYSSTSDCILVRQLPLECVCVCACVCPESDAS